MTQTIGIPGTGRMGSATALESHGGQGQAAGRSGRQACGIDETAGNGQDDFAMLTRFTERVAS